MSIGSACHRNYLTENGNTLHKSIPNPILNPAGYHAPRPPPGAQTMPRVTLYESEKHRAKREAREQNAGSNAVTSLVVVGGILGALYLFGMI